MAKKNKRKRKGHNDDFDNDDDFGRKPTLTEETFRVIYAIILFVVALFLIFSSFPNKKNNEGFAGPIGIYTYAALHSLFGIGYYLIPLLLAVFAVLLIQSLNKRSVTWPKILGAVLFLFAALGIINITFKDTQGIGRGGLIGTIVASPLIRLFDIWVTVIILVGVLIISTIILFDNQLSVSSIFTLFKKKSIDDEENIEQEDKEPLIVEGEKKVSLPVEPEILEKKDKKDAEDKGEDTGKGLKKILGLDKDKKVEAEGFAIATSRFFGKVYLPPPLSLLNEDRGKPGVGDIKANANIIKRTLQNFGINVEMDEISIGPSVTRYALKPAEGVKLSRIVGLQNDLSLALAAHPLRIEAPIPGKSLVGIEIPNNTKTTVGLGTMLISEEFKNSDKPLLIALGKGISGKSIFTNLAKAPHLLIAGATGSGKSVTIHTIITSLLYRNSPENLKFIMIDPKRVELTSLQ